MIRTHTVALAALLSACAVDRYYTAVSSDDLKDLTQEPVAAEAINVSGIDIWTTGVPVRHYKVLGVIHDIRRNAGYTREKYYADIARITTKVHGDGAIIVLADSKTTIRSEECISGMLTESECADLKSGGSFRAEDPVHEASIYSENRESNQAPLEYRESHILVIKYLR